METEASFAIVSMSLEVFGVGRGYLDKYIFGRL